MLDHVIRIYLILRETIELSSKVSVPFSIPTSSERDYLLLHILPSIGTITLLDFWHSSRYVLVSHF